MVRPFPLRASTRLPSSSAPFMFQSMGLNSTSIFARLRLHGAMSMSKPTSSFLSSHGKPMGRKLCPGPPTPASLAAAAAGAGAGAASGRCLRARSCPRRQQNCSQSTEASRARFSWRQNLKWKKRERGFVSRPGPPPAPEAGLPPAESRCCRADGTERHSPVAKPSRLRQTGSGKTVSGQTVVAFLFAQPHHAKACQTQKPVTTVTRHQPAPACLAAGLSRCAPTGSMQPRRCRTTLPWRKPQ